MDIHEDRVASVPREERIKMAGNIASAIFKKEEINFLHPHRESILPEQWLYHLIMAERADYDALERKLKMTTDKLKAVSIELSKLKKNSGL